MALRIGSTLLQNIYSDAVFNHTTGATLVGMAKRRVDAGADQALVGFWPAGMGHRHELYFTAADELVGAVEWQSAQTAALATNPSGWFWFAIRLNRVSGAPRVKFYYKPHLTGSVVSAELSDGGAEAAVGSPIDYEFRLGEGVAPWVAQSQADYAYVKAWEAALSDAEISAEMNAFAQVRTANEHSYLTLISKASVAAAVVDESGQGNDWSIQGVPTLDDAANPAGFGGTPPTIAVSSATPSGASVAVAGTYTSAAGSPTVTVELQAGSSGVTQSGTAFAAGGNWSITFANVQAGVYTARATITDANGSVLATSSSVEIVGLSGTGVLPHLYAAGSVVVTPEAASLSVSGTQVLTVVDANGLPLDGVVFTSSAPAVATVTSPSSSLGQVTVTGVAAGTATIQAAFSDPVGGTLSDSVAISVALLVPAAPTGLTAVALGSNRVRLAWTDNSSNETQFRVERAPAATGPWTQILTPSSNTVTADDTTVSGGTTYFYRVRAANADGPSDPSNVASIATPAGSDTTPPTITLSSNSTSITVDNSSIILSAQAEDNVGVTEVRFYRDGQQLGPMLTAPNAGTLYQVQQFFSGSAGNGTPVFTARAWDAAGNSTLSAPVVVSVNIPATGSAPVAPSNLVASLVTQTGCRLTWSDNSTNETAFLLERQVLPGGVWEQVQVLGADATQYDVTGLLANTGYGFRLRAQGSQLPSGYSNEVVITTLAAGATGLASLAVTPDTVSAMPGEVSVITVTALNGNGSSRPGVTITPTIATAAIAVVAPVNAITDASGKASFTVTFGATVGQTAITFVGNDGATTVAPPATPAVQLFTLPSITEALIKELQAEQTDPKYSEEITPLVWDFSEWMGRGEVPTSIESREVVPVGGQDRDPSSSAMLFGAARIVGVRVLQYVRDGLPGVSYYLRCKVRTNLGRVAVAEYRMRVYRGTGSRVSSGTSVVD